MEEGERITLLAILAVVMILVVYFELRVMRGRSKTARKVNIRKDEAYNSILTCRSVMNVLERQGVSVYEARSLVDKAKSHMLRGEHEMAIDLCERAREELTKARLKTRAPAPSASSAPADRDTLEYVAEEIVSEPRKFSRDDSYSGSRLEVQSGPNYLVAKFELNTVREDLARAESEGADVSAARDSLERAQAEFDSGNYAKALSMAVKVKKALGRGSEEAIPLKGREKVERPTELLDGQAAGVVDVCSSCGSEIDPEDAFCGSCGKRREKERVCPSCGRLASGSDKFCRKCGAKVP